MSEPKTVSPAEASHWVDSGEAVIIDVREPGEFSEEHITGAINHPVGALDTDALKGEAAGKKIVFQCASGKRAGMACVQFAQKTGDEAYLLDGSLPGWKQAGLPTEKGM